MFFLHKKHTDLLNSEHILTQNVSQFDIKISRGKVSSILKRGYQDNFKPVFFFLRKTFRAHKNTHKETLTNKTKLSKH